MRSPINARSAVLGSSAKLGITDTAKSGVKRTHLGETDMVDAVGTYGDGGNKHLLSCDITQVCVCLWVQVAHKRQSQTYMMCGS